MASTSASNSHLLELPPSTSTSMPSFITYEPPTTKLAFQSDKKYHVFLSFRGPDVRKTLIDHLFQALSAAGLNVFLDSEKLEKGEIIGESLERAIEGSAIRIPIFSKGYAESAWCLKEAAVMLNTPGLIIPLFYHVHPTHVRYSQGNKSPYKEAFENHYGHPDRQPREEVDEWKNALHQICTRSGWSMDLCQGLEGQLVKTVVNDLIRTLDRVPLQVAKHPVGLDNIKNLVLQKLNINSMKEMVKVGIWGIGGIGKTTVAKAVYNQIYTKFEAASFVANVRATAVHATGLTNLQKKILKDLTKNDYTVENVDEGISLFKDHLRGKRVLLILDDVDAIGQLNALVGDWLSIGSRIIITSRDKHILNVALISSQCLHEVSGLDINEGLQLFSWHAFIRASPSFNYRDLSKRIVEACKGHPLSLEVIGSFLYDKQDDTGCWMEALQTITLNPEIHKILYISYDALSNIEKEIFLDIACFFIGEAKRLPIIFWESLYSMVNIALSNLSMKLLIKIDGEGGFDMHDHLRDLGRTIAERESEGTRLWKAAHLNNLSNNVNFSRLWINGTNLESLEILYRPSLRYLHLQNVHIDGLTEDTRAMLPPSLIWFRLEDCTFTIGNNRVRNKIVTVTSKMYRALWKTDHSRFVGNIKQLKIMQLNNSNIRSIHPLFSLLNVQQMQSLELRQCGWLNNLPDTIGTLSQLEHLDLEGCGSLNNLPVTIGNLSQLKHLSLAFCGSLNNLPDTIGNLSQLQYLNLGTCWSLKNLPHTIGKLSQLLHLNLTKCASLNKLPNTIVNLSKLQHLDLGWCTELDNLPNTIDNLSQLRFLSLNGCKKLNNLPNTIGNLLQLQQLDLEHCESLNNLPDTIGNLSQLKDLSLTWCKKLKNLPNTIGNLPHLQRLDLGECKNLNNLPEAIGNLLQLKDLSLNGCSRLNNLPHTIDSLPQLQLLNLNGCSRLNNLPNTIGNLVQLQDLEESERLDNLPRTIGDPSLLYCLKLRNELKDVEVKNPPEYVCFNLPSANDIFFNLPGTIGKL